jgi:hypothetical protein
MIGHMRTDVQRDLPVASNENNSEASLSLGLGVTLAYF